jgi:hypothetical protein
MFPVAGLKPQLQLTETKYYTKEQKPIDLSRNEMTSIKHFSFWLVCSGA